MLHKGGDLVSELGLAAGPGAVAHRGRSAASSVRGPDPRRAPRLLDRRILRVQQAVDLDGKRLNLVGKVCPESAAPVRIAASLRRIASSGLKPTLTCTQAAAMNGGENGERRRQLASEGAARGMDLGAVDGDRGPDRAAAETLWQGDVPLQNRQRPPPGPAVA